MIPTSTLRAASTPPLHHPSHRLIRWTARIGLAAWTGFWTWFVASVALSEPLAWQPFAGLALLWSLAAITWFAPRTGAILLLAFAVWAGWFFAGSSAIWLIVAPPCGVAALSYVAAPRGRS